MLAALRRVLTILTVAAVWLAAFAAPSHAAPPKKPPPPIAADAGASPPPSTPPSPPSANGPLKVYTKPVEPFAFQVDGKPVGFSIDLWDRIAKDAGIAYEIHWVQTVGELIEALQKKEGDVAVAAISITAEREKIIDFSQPFYESGLGILVSASPQSPIRAVLRSLLSADFLKLCALLFGLLVITSHLLWFFERSRNPDQFPQTYLNGLWESAWWAISTILSGGCDNKGPIVIGGRIVGAFWMLTSIILVSYFTASITTAMTLNQLSTEINGPNDLPGKKVATVKGSTAESYLKNHRATVKAFTNIDDAYVALAKNEVVAVVYDSPILLYHAAKDPDGKQKVVGRIFQKQNYGIALQQESAHRKRINETLLKLRESGFLDELNTRWFGNQD
jgi:polar amino acid transport system substrate-binding protein